MSDLKQEGRIIAIMELERVTDSFSKREFVIETDDQYPQMIKFEFTQAKCDILDTARVGEDVVVCFNVRGRKWHNEKKGIDQYFNTLQAWRLEKVKEGATPSNNEPPPVDENMADNLPF